MYRQKKELRYFTPSAKQNQTRNQLDGPEKVNTPTGEAVDNGKFSAARVKPYKEVKSRVSNTHDLLCTRNAVAAKSGSRPNMKTDRRRQSDAGRHTQRQWKARADSDKDRE